MIDQKYKAIIGCTALVCLTALQLTAWITGHNGVVFATTSAIFGVVIGGYFNIKNSVKEFVKNGNDKQ